MGVSDVVGVFTRGFVVGFFLPAYFALVVLDLAVDPRALPAAYRELGEGTQLLVAGAVALLVALLLNGLHFQVLRLFEGYALQRLRDWPESLLGVTPFARWQRWAIARQQDRYDALAATREQPERSRARSKAARELARQFPDRREDLLPARFGNVIRSFEWHPRSRYNLNGIVAYPRIATMLNDREAELAADTRADVALFVNAALLSVVIGALVAIDCVWHGWWRTGYVALVVALPPLVYWAAYNGAVSAALRWGDAVRTSFDLHRLELYERLGLRLPTTDAEERQIAHTINRCLLFGEPLGDDFRKIPTKERP